MNWKLISIHGEESSDTTSIFHVPAARGLSMAYRVRYLIFFGVAVRSFVVNADCPRARLKMVIRRKDHEISKRCKGLARHADSPIVKQVI